MLILFVTCGKVTKVIGDGPTVVGKPGTLPGIMTLQHSAARVFAIENRTTLGKAIRMAFPS
jgi:hypothetical protein